MGMLLILGLFVLMAPSFLIAWSHVAANVPPPEKFDAILKRDLGAYFEESTGRPVTVEYEFLREGPTQSGLAYPKFYLWVKVYSDGTVIEEGAVRIAAMEKKQIVITDYLRKEEILSNPERTCRIFPKPVCEKILERVQNQR